MKTSHHLWIIAIIVVLIVFAFLGLTQKNKAGAYDEFAQCLTESGTKMYGAYWCPHCAEQKKSFGKSWKYVEYVECSLPNRGGQNKTCNDAGIDGYPTWQFGDGTRQGGNLPLEVLAERSTCELPALE